VDLFGYLFGSVLAVTRADLAIALALGLGVLLVVALLFKELLFVTFDPEMAAVAGLPVATLRFLLLTLVAVTVVVSLKVVGIVLVSALLVTPAATAYQLTSDFRRMMALSVLCGVGSTVAGLVLSYLLDTPSGATMVLVSTALFFLASWLSPRRRERRAVPPAPQP
jgi:ABC-type Mn2+/Zn2+ transport system permease subunit